MGGCHATALRCVHFAHLISYDLILFELNWSGQGPLSSRVLQPSSDEMKSDEMRLDERYER